MAFVSLRSSLLRDLLLIVVAMGVVLFGTAWFGARALLEEYAPLVVHQMLSRTEERLEGFFGPVRQHIRQIAAWGRAGRVQLDDPDGLTSLLLPLLRESPSIGSMIVADPDGNEIMLLRQQGGWLRRETRPGLWDGKHRIATLGPEGELRDERFEDLGYDPRTRPWFRGALQGADEAGVPTFRPIHWTEPYLFYTTKEPGLTASRLFVSAEGERRIVAVDVELARIREFTASIGLERGGRVAVLDEERRVIGHPGPAEGGTPLLVPGRDVQVPWLRGALDALPMSEEAQESTVLFATDDGLWLARGAPFALSEAHRLWMVVAVPGSELFVQVRRFLWIVVGLTLVVIALTSWRVFVIAGRVGGPLERLARNSERISRGQLDDETPLESRFVEIRRLADAQRQMRSSLRELLDLENELQVARQIQQASFPARMPSLAGWEIAAFSAAARETGGDMYDVIGLRRAVGSGQIVLADSDAEEAVLFLADATGHGLGPALSVSQLRAMLRLAVRLDAEPTSVLRKMNAQLCSDLRAGHFVTAWFAAIDAELDDLVSISFGQAPLLLWRAGPGTLETLGADILPLGLEDPLDVPSPRRLSMQKGDLCLVVSDGIHEARDPAGEIYGVERLEHFVRTHATLSATEVVTALRHEVDRFRGSAPRRDDQTVIAVRRRSGRA